VSSFVRNLAWIALILGRTAQVFAQGGPPLLTDDPGTPGNKNWEINIASTHFRSPGEREIEAPLLDINYGLGDRIQLKYEVPYLFDSDQGAPYLSALGNSLIGEGSALRRSEIILPHRRTKGKFRIIAGRPVKKELGMLQMSSAK
jgi:hypothetical protein